ncbi:MAG: MFS transporter [Holophaga sp.]
MAARMQRRRNGLVPTPAAGPFRGLVGVLGVTQILSWGTLFYSFPILVLPMGRDLGWSPQRLNGAVSVGLLAMGAASVPMGAWIDHHGGRAVMVLGSVLGAAGLGLWAWARTPAWFGLAWIVLGLAMAGTLYEAAFAVLAGAFGPEAPRRIATLTFLGGLASTVCFPMTQALADLLHWRGALWVLAAVNLLVCAPLHAAVVPRAPARVGAPSVWAGGEAGRALVRSRPFWGLALCFPACTLVTSALVFQLVPLLSGWGLGKAAVLGCMMLFGPLQSGGRMAWVALGRRLRARGTGLVVVASFLTSLLVLLLAPHRPVWLGAAVAVLGLGNGLLTIVRGTAVPELVGVGGYGEVNGLLTLPVMAARACGPAAAAAIWFRTGDPAGMLWALVGCTVVGSLGFLGAIAARQTPRLTAPAAPPGSAR